MKFLILSIILLSCAHMRSGSYYQIQAEDSWSKIAASYDIDVEQLKSANSNSTLIIGEWIFVPQKIGFLREDSLDPTLYVGGAGEFSWPVPGTKKISSHYGRRGSRHHDGIDIPAPRGTHFVAVEHGKVTFAGWMRGYGRVIVLTHSNGLKTVYAHNAKNLVGKGDRVSRGQIIGKVGNSGRSTGAHLHFEIRKDKQPLNPKTFLAYYP